MHIEFRTGEESNPIGPYIIEICGTPIDSRHTYIAETFVDQLYHRGLNVGYKPLLHQRTFPTFQTTDDLLKYARTSVDILQMARSRSSNNSILLDSSVFEELGYLELYKRQGVLTEDVASAYTSLMLAHGKEVDMVILILTSPESSLSMDPIINLPKVLGDDYISVELGKLSAVHRRIMNKEVLTELNNCFDYVLNKYAARFSKFHIVDLRDKPMPMVDRSVMEPLLAGVFHGLARIYPFSPNPFTLPARIPEYDRLFNST